MMLKLYSFGPGANSLKPMLALYEKGLDFTIHQLNPQKFEHHEDWFKAINPRGQVPALEHDGHIITESTVICEYLEDVFPGANPLRPSDPLKIAEMRVWTKWVDEYFCWCVSTIGWERHIGPMARAFSDVEFEAYVARIPVPEQQTKWRHARNGFPKDILAEELRKIGVSVRKLDDQLSKTQWLVGDEYTLADICNYAIAGGMQFGFPEFVNASETPHLLRWIEAVAARPAAQLMYQQVPSEFARPQAEAAKG
jgi:glutathione S-transferase